MDANLQIGDILFLDIETVPAHPSWDEVPEDWRGLWEEKSAFYRERQQVELPQSYERAGIYAEFGKVICVGVGYFSHSADGQTFRLTCFSGDEERELLAEFGAFLEKHYRRPFRVLCAHNGKEFDFPFLSRRFLIQGLPVPAILQFAGKKPWEVPHLDTMELWKFGDYKNFTSLKLLARAFGIPGPKEDIDGSQVAGVYWKEADLARIDRYCRRDVVTLARVFQRFRGEEAIGDNSVIHL